MTIPNNGFRTFAGPSEMLLHEWLHIVEGCYSERGFSVGEDGLHGGEKHGYRAGVEGDWLHWYRPFMRGQVREKGNFVGIPPAAWTKSARLVNRAPLTQFREFKGRTRIINRESGKSLDVLQSSSQAGAKLVQREYTGSLSQIWRLEPSQYYIMIVNEKSGLAIDAPKGSKQQGVQLIQYDKDAKRHSQLWSVEHESSFLRIRSPFSELVLDVDHASHSNDAKVLQWGRSGDKNQMWLVLPVIGHGSK